MHHSWVIRWLLGTQAGETAWLASRARQGVSDGGTVHRGLLLEFDADAAARGVSERPLGLVDEAVEPKTV